MELQSFTVEDDMAELIRENWRNGAEDVIAEIDVSSLQVMMALQRGPLETVKCEESCGLLKTKL